MKPTSKSWASSLFLMLSVFTSGLSLKIIPTNMGSKYKVPTVIPVNANMHFSVMLYVIFNQYVTMWE